MNYNFLIIVFILLIALNYHVIFNGTDIQDTYKKTIFLIIFINIFVIFCVIVNTRANIEIAEGYTDLNVIDREAMQNAGSVLNQGKLTITDLVVTGTATINNLTSNIITSNNLTSGNITSDTGIINKTLAVNDSLSVTKKASINNWNIMKDSIGIPTKSMIRMDDDKWTRHVDYDKATNPTTPDLNSYKDFAGNRLFNGADEYLTYGKEYTMANIDYGRNNWQYLSRDGWKGSDPNKERDWKFKLKAFKN